jgi:hypothetical protein
MRREEQKPLPPEALNAKLIAGLRLAQCWHPQASRATCSPKIVRAHTLQRASVLGRIADAQKHVLTFCPPSYDRQGVLIPTTIGWQEASTFRGFCQVHDASLFAPIETKPFIATEEQCFLLAYRAACHELHQKQSMWDHSPAMQGLWDRGMTPAEQTSVQAERRSFLGSVGWSLAQQIRLKQRMDRALGEKRFDDWQFAMFNLSGVAEIASTGMFSPNVDLAGNTIQKELLFNAQSLAFGTVVEDSATRIVFAWQKIEAAPRLFLDSLLSFDRKVIPHLLTQIIFAYVENTFFSRAWWESRRLFVQEQIGRLATLPHPYMNPPEYVRRHVSAMNLESAVFL